MIVSLFSPRLVRRGDDKKGDLLSISSFYPTQGAGYGGLPHDTYPTTLGLILPTVFSLSQTVEPAELSPGGKFLFRTRIGPHHLKIKHIINNPFVLYMYTVLSS